MNIKTGYKQTEIGVIPEDWEVRKLDECLTLLTDFEANGSFEDVAKNVTIYDAENFAWYVRATDLENSSSLSKVKFVDKKTYKFLNKTQLFGGEVLITKRGEIGKVYFFEMKTSFATVAPNMYLLKLNDTVLPIFIFLFFKSNLGYKSLVENNASTTLGALYKNAVKSILIPIPPLLEQTAIAAALSDVDALMGELDKLIAKKRDIKQATMQQLLTGKKRLAGFSGEWGGKRLGDVAVIATGNTPPTNDISNYGDEFLFVSPADLDNGKYIFQTEKMLSKKGFQISRRFPKNSILFVCIGSTIGKCGISSVELTSNQQINAVFPSSNYSTDYLYYFINSKSNEIKASAGEQAVPIVNKTQFSDTQISLPRIEEQTAIATILSDMDAEINALQQKRDKTAQLKQGMMQELLTGRVRLNPQESTPC